MSCLHGRRLAGDACAQAAGGDGDRGDDRPRSRRPAGFQGQRSRARARRGLASQVRAAGAAWPTVVRAGRRWPGAARGTPCGSRWRQTMTMIAYAPVLLLLILLVSAIKMLREYERGVVFQLGRYWKVKGPGLLILIPVVQQMVRVDLRTIVMDVPEQDVISRDTLVVQVPAVGERTNGG